MPACVHFRKEAHDFIQHANFTLIEQLTETENVNKATLKLPLKYREDFWILKIGTLSPKGLNQELNNVQSQTAAFRAYVLPLYCR